MKNWIIVLLIFILPLGMYAYLDARAQSEKMCKVEGNELVKSPKAKIIKFYSVMCSECKEQTAELNKAMENYKDSVIVEEINVVEQNKALKKHSKAAIKQFDINLVPTVVFLNKDGAIIKKHRGLMKADEIIEVLNGIE